MKQICDHDCFNCKYDDCICDDMTLDDYAEARDRDFELTHTSEQKKIAAKQKAYYEANRDKIAAKQKAYREANRDEIAAKNAEIKALRKRLKLSQKDVAVIFGVSKQLVSLWELGYVECFRLDEVVNKLRQLEETERTVCG